MQPASSARDAVFGNRDLISTIMFPEGAPPANSTQIDHFNHMKLIDKASYQGARKHLDSESAFEAAYTAAGVAFVNSVAGLLTLPMLHASVTILTDGLVRFRHSPSVQNEVCLDIADFLEHGTMPAIPHQEAAFRIRLSNIPSAVVAAMHTNIAFVSSQAAACLLIYRLSKDGLPRVNQPVAVEAAQAVTNAMRGHASHARLSYNGCLALSALCDPNDERADWLDVVRAQIFACNGIDLLLDVMYTHADNNFILRAAMKALSCVCMYSTENRRYMVFDGGGRGAYTILTLMMGHLQDPSMTILGLKALDTISAELECAEVVVRLGGVGAALKCMIGIEHANSQNVNIQSHGLKLLVKLLVTHAGRMAFYEAKGTIRVQSPESSSITGLDLVLHAMTTHYIDVDIAEMGCGILFTMLQDEEFARGMPGLMASSHLEPFVFCVTTLNMLMRSHCRTKNHGVTLALTICGVLSALTRIEHASTVIMEKECLHNFVHVMTIHEDAHSNYASGADDVVGLLSAGLRLMSEMARLHVIEMRHIHQWQFHRPVVAILLAQRFMELQGNDGVGLSINLCQQISREGMRLQRELLRYGDATEVRTTGKGGVLAVVRAMHAFPSDQEIQELGCSVLNYLTSTYEPGDELKLSEYSIMHLFSEPWLGTIVVMMAACSANAHNMGLVIDVCQIIARVLNIGWMSADNMRQLLDAGCMRIVLHAMYLHTAGPATVITPILNALLAMTTFIAGPTVTVTHEDLEKARTQVRDVRPIITLIIQSHAGDVPLQTQAQHLLDSVDTP